MSAVETASGELAQVRALARDFATAELRPHVESWDAARAIDPAALAHMAELGFWGLLARAEYGGLDFDLPTYLAVLEELSWGEPAVGLTLSIHSAFGVRLIQEYGSDAQRARWLSELASGALTACFALSEPGAGSDARAVETKARRDGDEWVLSGTKKWVTNARSAGLALVVARTDEGGGGPATFGMFLVPTGADGFVIGARETTMGLRSVEILAVELEDLRLPGDALLGDAGQGMELAMDGLRVGRLGIAAQAVGIARAALEHARAYADEREQFGTSLRHFEAIQFKLADMATRAAAASALLGWAGSEPTPAHAAMAKLFASENAMWITTQAVQIFGGYGYMRDYPVEKLMRDAKATEIYEGTNEIQRVIIARSLYDD
ncbi:MAG TPA: acyl-CoA dehydrogenase family protein [Longimicrobiales bacterium]|nr:acyl-CoA dehydrogenase family protein [Longimicrobiales bacterium]